MLKRVVCVGILLAGEAHQTLGAMLWMWEGRFSVPEISIEMYMFLRFPPLPSVTPYFKIKTYIKV